ncbi:2,5-diamino-6-(ribosylamino)-4(3H)-pyrimidinone 5'-phosphate reductase [Halanaeroarchaeum sulfurireducens]|uniref:2,5-diamino-6-(ribosylamino)-4(3H)-pyrimidinone 5'-phosphate reductase n=1 Tax=Halanaeroarchaeum sulfurireducens TaxID=1604004 RepID=A0A0F7PAD3_9EURY|nr:2,5-diamino-6-(ribosylamino)-4(3H)-pyrimidinone 5'-phosphate reductase [Halanaeroarchaeum sulfurireducens]AKH98131.1 5-amino-6-(5-phosphoribosylamino)uracil reductase [Halanaeroarchaeum sulfurireducens]
MHVVVNAAESVDGKIATREREQLRISGPEDFARVDRLRASVDAVMVGVETVRSDDPSLTLDDESLVATRTADGKSPHPARVVADSRGRTPPEARVLDDTAETYILTSEATTDEYRRSLEEGDATPIVAGSDRVDLGAAFEALAAHGIESIMVEGGGELIFSLFAADLVDELRVYVGSMIVGGRGAPTLADGDGFVGAFPDLSLESVERLDDGVLLEYDVTDADRGD